MEHFPISSWTFEHGTSPRAPLPQLSLSSAKGGAASKSSVEQRRRLASATPDRGQLFIKRPGRPAPLKRARCMSIATLASSKCRAGGWMFLHSYFLLLSRAPAESGFLSGVRYRFGLSQFANSLAIHRQRFAK